MSANEKPKRKFFLAVLSAISAVLMAAAFVQCGGDDNGKNDGGDSGQDGTVNDDGNPPGDGGGFDAPFCDGGPNCMCLNLGAKCNVNGDCCSNVCNNGTCDYPKCTSDNQACTQNGQCCSGMCTGGKCTPLNNTCKTLGNSCMQSGDCCSKLCKGGICSPSSFCGQSGDVCATGADCCTGICNKPMNQQLGTCNADPPGGPANCGQVDGVLCGTPDGGFQLNDAGLPACGGACCSRNCSPYGPTSMLICQPASGCHVVGDLCQQDKDCCGSNGLPGGSGKPVVCDKSGGYPIGICRNPMGCKPNGDICRLKTMSCNASCDCCIGNCQNADTCHQDILGVPRCSYPCDGGAPQPNQACATSADCCGYPCVPNPNYTPDSGVSPLTCSPQKCQSCGQKCTVTADCCPGTGCIIQNGSTSGTCGPCSDGGMPLPDGGCNQYGQLCNTGADCCNGVPCTNGRCEFPPPN